MDISKILSENKNKSFVQRILNPHAYPVLQNPDGTVSTHSMAWAEANDGKFYVYPTVLTTPKGQLVRHSDDDAWKHTQATGNFLVFDSAEEADYFSKHYKDAWDNSLGLKGVYDNDWPEP